MARLGLRLLGGFLLRADGRPRPLPARKAQALLAYLAVRGGRAHAREALTGLFWADAGERQARQSLRQIMVRLRREGVFSVDSRHYITVARPEVLATLGHF